MDNKRMPKSYRGQNHEKTMWALSELKIYFVRQQNGRGGVLRLQNARQDAFLDLWLRSLTEEWASPICGEQT